MSFVETLDQSTKGFFMFVGMGNCARDLANSLLQNVVDTYRKENESICAAFEEIERIALNAPKSTKEMIELGEYMLHVKNKRMLQLTVKYIIYFFFR